MRRSGFSCPKPNAVSRERKESAAQMPSQPYPRTGEPQESEEDSWIALRRRFRQPRFLLREDEHDIGQDGTIEVGHSTIRGEWPNERVAFQLKSTSSASATPEGTVTYRIDSKNLNYLDSQLPSIYFLYDRRTQRLYMEWAREIIAALHHTTPNWNRQKTVSVHFQTLVDEPTLREIEFAVRSHARQAREIVDGYAFLRNPTRTSIHSLFPSHEPFAGREGEIKQLADRVRPNFIIPILGPPGSGKSELVAQFVGEAELFSRAASGFALPACLLKLEMNCYGENRVFRSLAWALGQSQMHAAPDIGLLYAPNSDTVRAELLGQILPARLRNRSPLMVVENAQEVLADSRLRSDLDLILASASFRDGCALVLSHHGPFPTGNKRRNVAPTIEVSELKAMGGARELLCNLINPPEFVDQVLDQLQRLNVPLLPEVLVSGAAEYYRRVTDQKFAASATTLTEAIIDSIDPVVDTMFKNLSLDLDAPKDNATTALTTLLAMAIIGKYSFKVETLARCLLPLPDFDRLRDAHWIVPEEGIFTFTDAGLRLSRSMARRLLVNATPIATNLQKAILTIVQDIENSSDRDQLLFARAIDESLAWISVAAPIEKAILRTLETAFIAFSIEDLIFPRLPEDHSLARSTDSHGEELTDILASLTLAIREEAPAPRILELLRAAVLAAKGQKHFRARQLRTLDVALSSATHRHPRLRQEVLQLYVSLCDVLSTYDELYRNAAVRTAIGSCNLSAALLFADAGKRDESKQHLARVHSLIDFMPVSRRPFDYDSRLLARMMLLEARMARSAIEREGLLRELVSFASREFAESANEIDSLRFFVHSVQHLIEEIVNDDDRWREIDSTIAVVKSHYNVSESDLPLITSVLIAALIRHAAALTGDLSVQVERACQSVEMLSPFAGEIAALANSGDSRPMLSLARSYAYLSVCQGRVGDLQASWISIRQAIEICEQIVKDSPSAAAWDLFLRLVDQERNPLANVWDGDPFAVRSAAVSPALRERMSACRHWLKKVKLFGEEEGRLLLTLTLRQWTAEGSLEAFARITSGRPEDEWIRVPSSTKLKYISGLYKQRSIELNGIEKLSGPFVDLYIARFRLESQFQRLIAIYQNVWCKTEEVFRILETARAFWPSDQELNFQVAAYQRYTWDHTAAISTLRSIVEGASGGEQRRAAIALLVETLLTASVYCASAENEAARYAEEARSMIPALLGFRHVSREAALLRDRVSLELNEPVDWAAIDKVFENVVGGVAVYPSTVARNVVELRQFEIGRITTLAEAVMQDFTNPDVLGSLGQLYLRRGETKKGLNPLSDCQRAYAVFDACRLLEQASFGMELPTTSYRRGRAILVGVHLAKSIDPFPVYRADKKDALQLAQACLDSAKSRSINKFRQEAQRLASEAGQVRKTLRAKS